MSKKRTQGVAALPKRPGSSRDIAKRDGDRMLHTDKQFASDEASRRIWRSTSAEPLGNFVQIAVRQLPVMIISTALITALGLLYLFTTAPTYIATASVVIDVRKAQSYEAQQDKLVPTDSAVDSGTVQSQIELLKSADLARSVVNKFRLASDPEFVGSDTGFTGAVAKVISAFFGTAELSDTRRTRLAVAALQEKCTIIRIGGSHVIGISVELHDPEKAARIANAIVDAYLNNELEAKYAAARRATMWLQDRAKELQAQASAARRAVVEFKAKNNIVIVNSGEKQSKGNEGRLMNDQELSEVNSQFVLAQAATAGAKARYERIREIMKQGLPEASVAEALKSEVLIKLREQYLDLAAREAVWSQRYGPNHLAAVNLRSQMVEILHSIKDEMQKIEESAKSDYEIAQTRERGIRESLNQAVSRAQVTDQARIQLEDLESSAETAVSLYNNFLERQMHAIQQQSFPIPEARLVDSAEPPLRNSHPKKSFVLLATGVIGLVVGYCIAYIRELYDGVFRSREQVEEFLLVKCLAILPNLQAIKSPNSSSQGAKSDSPVPSALARRWPLLPSHLSDKMFSHIRGAFWPAKEFLLARCHAVFPDLHVTVNRGAAARRDTQTSRSLPAATSPLPLLSHVLDEPFSQFTEALRSVKTASDLKGRQESLKVIGLTSILPQEGKSTIAANFAQLIAQVGCSVVLVDADLRNPTLSRQFAPKRRGLVEVIMGRQTFHDVMMVDRRTGLKVLPSGAQSRLLNTNELLASAAMKKLIDELRDSCDYIIVDLPPLIPIVDARAAVNFIDSYILVVEWGRTRIDTAKRSLSNAPDVYERVLGVVMNKVNMAVLGRYEPDLRSYYGKYFAQYSTVQ
jgi:succinoglycan biosynthesis transport protein ExoP